MQRIRSIFPTKHSLTTNQCRPTSYRVNPAFEDDLDSEDISARHHPTHLFRRSRTLLDHRPRASSTLHERNISMRLLALTILTLSIAITLLQIVSSVNSKEAVKVLKGVQTAVFLPLNGTRVIRPVTASTDNGLGANKKSRRATVVLEGFDSAISSALSDLDKPGDRSSAPEERSPSGMPATTWKRTVGVATSQLEASPSNVHEATDDDVELNVSEACATYLNEPIEWISRLDISSMTLAIFQLWMLVILGTAWYQVSSSHLGAVALSQTLVSFFAIVQVVLTYKHLHANVASQILLGPCSLGQPLVPGFWSLTIKTQIAVAVLQPLGSVAIGLYSVKFADRIRRPDLRENAFPPLRAWATIQPLDHHGSSKEASRRARFLVSSFELLSTSSIFFVVAFQAIWLGETIQRPSPAFDNAPNWIGVTEQIGVGVLMVLGTYAMAMGQVGLRYRFRSVMVLSLLGNLAFLVHTICLLSQPTFRAVQASFWFLSFLLVVSTALILFTLILGTATLFTKQVWSSLGADVSEVSHSDNPCHDSEVKSSDLDHSNTSLTNLPSPVIVDYRRPKASTPRSHILNRSSNSHVSHQPHHSYTSSTSTVNTTGTWKESDLGRQRSRSMSLELATSRMIPLRSLGSQDGLAAHSLRSERMASSGERGTMLGMAHEGEFIDELKDERDLFRRVTPRRLRNPSKASVDVPLPAVPGEDTLGVGGDDPFRPVTPIRLRRPSVPLDASESEDVESITVAAEAAVKRSTRAAVNPFIWTTAEPFVTTLPPPKGESWTDTNIPPEIESILSPTSYSTTQATPSAPSLTLPVVRAPDLPPSNEVLPTPILSPLPHLSLSDFLFKPPSPDPTPVPSLRITDAQDQHGHDNEHGVPLQPLPKAQIYDRSKTHRVRSIDQHGAQSKPNGRSLAQPNKKYPTMGYKPLQEASGVQSSKQVRPKPKSSFTPIPQISDPRERRESVMDRPHPVVYERWTLNWPTLE